MSAPRAHLVVRQGPSSRQEHPITAPTTSIGREATNDIVLFDPEVSRRHAQITFKAGRYYIEDLGSTNGTFVNQQLVTGSVPLANGDVIDMGESARLTFHGPGGGASETVIETPVEQVGAPTLLQTSEIPPAAPAEPSPQPAQPPPVMPAQPPKAAPPPPAQRPAAPEETGRDYRRIGLGCGCLFFLAVVACGAALFLLDALAPEALYCGPLTPLYDLLGFQLSCT
jgi:pSer/pThr/pTyr-binding forkhead associated (FHA) protein